MRIVGTPQRLTVRNTARVTAAQRQTLLSLVGTLGQSRTCWLLRTSSWTIDALISGGPVMRATAEHVGELLDIVGRPS